jgi:copper(I)-binding protein
MMKSRFILAGLALCVLLGASAVALARDAGTMTCSLVSLFNGWAPATIPGAPNGVVYGLVVNLGGTADTLVGASSDAAEAVELHQSSVDDSGVMRMEPVEGGLEIPAGSYVALQQGGYHLMLVNLKAPLEAGGSLDLTLNFKAAGAVSIKVPIRELAASDMAGMSMDMGTPDAPMSGTEAMATPEMAMGGMSMAATPDWGACAGLHVVGAWTRPSLPGAPNTGAYALLLNLTGQDDTLVSASTPVDTATELHEMIMGANDVMQMRPVEGGITVAAGGATELKPGGLHVMLIGLKTDVPEGSTVPITYTFASGTAIMLDVPVHAPPESGMAMGGK